MVASYLVHKQLQDEGGHAAVDADEEVDGGQHHVGRAGHREEEGGRVHQRGDGPPGGGGEETRVTDTDQWGADLCIESRVSLYLCDGYRRRNI